MSPSNSDEFYRLRGLIEQNTGLLGSALRNERVKRSVSPDKEVEEIGLRTKRLRLVRSSITTTYNNFVSLNKDLQILARAMAADLAIDMELNELQKQRDQLNDTKVAKQSQLSASIQNTLDDREEENGFGRLINFLKYLKRGRPKPKGPRTRRPRQKIPRTRPKAPGKVPTKVEDARRARLRAEADARLRAQAEANARARADIEARQKALSAQEADARARYQQLKADAEARANAVERQRAALAQERADIDRARSAVINEQTRISRLQAELDANRAAVNKDRAAVDSERARLEGDRARLVAQESALRADLDRANADARARFEAEKASVDQQRLAAQADFENQRRVLAEQKANLAAIQNDYNKSWAARQAQLEAELRASQQRVTQSAGIGSAAVREAQVREAAAAAAVAEHSNQARSITYDNINLQQEIDREIRSLQTRHEARLQSIPEPRPPVVLQPPPAQVVSPAPSTSVPKNVMKAAAWKVILTKPSGFLLKKVFQTMGFAGPAANVGLAAAFTLGAVLGAVRLARGDILGAGIETASSLPRVGLLAGISADIYLFVHDTYFEIFKVYPHLDPEPAEVVVKRLKEVHEVVKETLQEWWEKEKASWAMTMRERREAARQTRTGRGTLSDFFGGQESARVLSGGTPIERPGISVLMPNATVGDAIKEAARLTGVDEAILLAMAQQESGFRPNAIAGSTGAKGLFQFLDSTWNDMVTKYGKQYPQLLKGPYDPLASAIAGALYIKENQKILEKSGIPVTGSNIYATHFLGPYGAVKLLTADPYASAASILPRAAAFNKDVFFNSDGTPKTVAQLADFLYGKVGKKAEDYAAFLQQQNTMGTTLASASVSIAANQQQRSSTPPVVLVRDNTKVVPVPTQTASGYTEHISWIT